MNTHRLRSYPTLCIKLLGRELPYFTGNLWNNLQTWWSSKLYFIWYTFTENTPIQGHQSVLCWLLSEHLSYRILKTHHSSSGTHEIEMANYPLTNYQTDNLPIKLPNTRKVPQLFIPNYALFVYHRSPYIHTHTNIYIHDCTFVVCEVTSQFENGSKIKCS